MKKIISCALFFFVCISLFSLEIPALTKTINDYANVLDSSQQQELEEYLRKVEKTSKIQVALLVISNLEDEVLEDYSMRVVEKWKLGDAKHDSGVLLLIAKKERKVRIEVGYGLEKDLTDAVSSQIIRNVITPYLKQDDYYNGIKEGLKAIVGYALKDESLIKDTTENAKKVEKTDTRNSYWYLYVIIPIILSSIMVTSRGARGQSRWGILWTLLYSLLEVFSRGGRYGRWRGTSRWTPYDGSPFSSDDDDGSNTFSGKGGSFGGGGASGGW